MCEIFVLRNGGDENDASSSLQRDNAEMRTDRERHDGELGSNCIFMGVGGWMGERERERIRSLMIGLRKMLYVVMVGVLVVMGNDLGDGHDDDYDDIDDRRIPQ